MVKFARNRMKWGREVFCPTNPDLADILGDMDMEFENFVFDIFWIQNLQSQAPRFPKSGPGQAGLGPGLGPRVDLSCCCVSRRLGGLGAVWK